MTDEWLKMQFLVNKVEHRHTDWSQTRLCGFEYTALVRASN